MRSAPAGTSAPLGAPITGLTAVAVREPPRHPEPSPHLRSSPGYLRTQHLRATHPSRKRNALRLGAPTDDHKGKTFNGHRHHSAAQQHLQRRSRSLELRLRRPLPGRLALQGHARRRRRDADRRPPRGHRARSSRSRSARRTSSASTSSAPSSSTPRTTRGHLHLDGPRPARGRHRRRRRRAHDQGHHAPGRPRPAPGSPPPPTRSATPAATSTSRPSSTAPSST